LGNSAQYPQFFKSIS